MTNLYCASFHESPECAEDLIRNLQRCDPESGILAHNPKSILPWHVPIDRYPATSAVEWGQGFRRQYEIMRYAIERYDCQMVTFVDSDQLATRGGYSAMMARHLQPGIGAWSRNPGDAPADLGPVRSAKSEAELWRPFLQGMPFRWAFGPGTTYTREGIERLVAAVETDSNLCRILERAQAPALEEVFFVTAMARLGLRIEQHPASQDFLQWRVPYTLAQVDEALSRPDVFWIHPIPRVYDNPLRVRIREALR